MNRIFRLIWSAARQCWVVASEKVSSNGGIPARTVGSLAAVAFLASGGLAFALPTGNNLVAGQATVSTPAAGQMQITQTSNRAIINWQSFGIASGETVNITQPSSSAALLNRVVGNSGSEIFGKLTANGQVFLVNPNGVLFGRGAEVNVGGLVASSLNIANDDFMNSNLKFFKDGTAGSVVNQGSISAGFAALLGPIVDNSGSIITCKGSTALGAADAVTLNFDTQGLIALKLDQGAYNAQVQNSGIIEADGGRVLLTAKSADDVLKSMVNTTGIIKARTVENKNGEILLLGDMQNGTTTVDGIIDATAPTSGNGGFVETSADKVQVADSARVTTLAANGQNGIWLIDPDGFTIAASGGDMTGLAVQTALSGGNFSILSISGSGGDGNINVNDAITWNANQLTLTATNDINVNAVMTAGGTASVDFEPGSGNLNMGLSGSGFYGRVDFPGRSGVGFLTIGGQGYTVINSLGAEGSTTGTDLQGMQGNLAGKYALGADIDATATSGWVGTGGFVPLGLEWSAGFDGAFNGLGHTISNLTINKPASAAAGLFAIVNSAGVVRNIGLTSVSITGGNNVGGLAGQNSGTISNSYVTGTVSGNTIVGGLVGGNINTGIGSTSISSSYSTASVIGTVEVGGLAGRNYGASVSSSYATGNVLGGVGSSYLGGLVGLNQSVISLSYATGNVTGGNNSHELGGLVGTSTLAISDSYATGSVAGGIGSYSLGGLLGLNFAGTVTNSYWNITSSGQATSDGGSGLTTAQMQQQASFTGWDFSNTWRIYEGNSYPLLKAFLTPLTITASNASKSYDGNAYTGGNGVTYSVAGAGASPNLLGTLAYSGTSQGAINAGSYVITPTGLYSNQQGYDISYANGSLTVDKAGLTVTANNAAKTYGQAISFAGSEFTSSGLQNGETIGSVSLASAGTAATANVSGSPYSITASNASGGTFSAGNYTITYQNGSLTISPAALTATANNASKTYDATAYTGGNGVTYSGFVNSETAAVLGGLLAYGGTSQGAVSVGNYTIIPSGLTAGNYAISYVNGALTISAAVTPPATPDPTPDPTPTPTPAPVVEQQSPLRDHLVSLQAALNMPATSDQQPEHHGLLFMPQSGAVQAGSAMEDGPNRLLMVLNGGIKR